MSNKDFTQEEAKQQMQAGENLTHTSFTPEEFVYMKGEDVYDEKNYPLNNFWAYRQNVMYQTGWSIYKK